MHTKATEVAGAIRDAYAGRILAWPVQAAKQAESKAATRSRPSKLCRHVKPPPRLPPTANKAIQRKLRKKNQASRLVTWNQR